MTAGRGVSYTIPRPAAMTPYAGFDAGFDFDGDFRRCARRRVFRAIFSSIAFWMNLDTVHGLVNGFLFRRSTSPWSAASRVSVIRTVIVGLPLACGMLHVPFVLFGHSLQLGGHPLRATKATERPVRMADVLRRMDL